MIDTGFPFFVMVIVEYLAFKLNEAIRIKHGLAYSPGTWIDTTGQFGLIGVTSDVNLDDIDKALSLIKVEMTLLDKQPMTLELLEKTRLKILLQSVQGYESNSDFAGYYVSKYVLFRKDRFYKNNEEKLEAVTVDDITRVVRKYLSDDKGITVIETPTLTFTQFYSLLSLIAVELGVSAILSTEYSNKCRNNLKELNESIKLAYYANQMHVPPLNLGISAFQFKTKQEFPKYISFDEPIKQIDFKDQPAIMDPKGYFKIYINNKIR